MEATFPVGVGGNHEFSIGSYFQQIPVEFTMDDLLQNESGAGHTPPDPHSSGNSSNYSTAVDAMEVYAAAGQGQPVQHLTAPTAATVADSHTEWDWTEINPDLSQIQVPPYPVGDHSTSAGAGTEAMMQSASFDFNIQEVNATHTHSAAAVEDIPPAVNAGLAHPQPDPYSTGYSTCPSTTTDMGTSSPDLEVNARAGLLQSGGALTEAPVGGSCKRKKLVSGSSSQGSTPPEFNLVESEAGLIQSDPSSADIKPPTGSTDREIISFLRRVQDSMPDGTEVNLSLGEQDRMAPKAVRSYVTTVRMTPDQKTHLGYWKEKPVEAILAGRCNFLKSVGLKRTFQFHRYDGTKTNWFMDEYILTDFWGVDLFMKDLRFREVYKGAEVPDPGGPTSPEVKIKNNIAAAKKHRMRGPEDLVIKPASWQHLIKIHDRHPELDGSNLTVVKGESPVWQHFIKIYDRHPELEGSKVVYAVCCHCEGVLKAGTENGTKSLLTHRDRTCPVKNKNQQPRSSS